MAVIALKCPQLNITVVDSNSEKIKSWNGPLDKLPVYEGMFGEYPVSNKLGEQVISLPIWPELDAATQQIVFEVLASCSQRCVQA